MHILIVDDNNSMRQLVEGIVMQAGHTFLSVASGASVLEHLDSGVRKPDLIVSDYSMPGMTGIELLWKIKGDPEFADIPFILMTGGNDLGETQALEVGCAGFLQKPFDVGEFQELVTRLLKK